MGKRQPTGKSSLEIFSLSALTGLSVVLGFMLLSNHEGVKNLTHEVARTEEDLVELVRQIRTLSINEMTPEEEKLEAEKLARERLHWTAPGEFILQIETE
jgi:hypothetical protein